MNQKQVKNLFKESEKKNINKTELPIDIQKKLTDDDYTIMQEPIRENADLLLLQDKISEEPIILLLIERDPYEIEIIEEFL
jgi:hypothetical protein